MIYYFILTKYIHIYLYILKIYSYKISGFLKNVHSVLFMYFITM